MFIEQLMVKYNLDVPKKEKKKALTYEISTENQIVKTLNEKEVLYIVSVIHNSDDEDDKF